METQTLNANAFYENLRPEFERKADSCPGCKYALELLPKLLAGQTTTADNEKMVSILTEAEILCKDCHGSLSQYQSGVYKTLGQVEIEKMRKKTA
jgi:hypothetical protein